MKMPKYEIEIKEPSTIGKTRAYANVKIGPVWISCRLDESKGKFFLNPPASFVESLEGPPGPSDFLRNQQLSSIPFLQRSQHVQSQN